jgi:hypothetical protein
MSRRVKQPAQPELPKRIVTLNDLQDLMKAPQRKRARRGQKRVNRMPEAVRSGSSGTQYLALAHVPGLAEGSNDQAIQWLQERSGGTTDPAHIFKMEKKNLVVFFVKFKNQTAAERFKGLVTSSGDPFCEFIPADTFSAGASHGSPLATTRTLATPDSTFPTTSESGDGSAVHNTENDLERQKIQCLQEYMARHGLTTSYISYTEDLTFEVRKSLFLGLAFVC